MPALSGWIFRESVRNIELVYFNGKIDNKR